jgi:hypothetical protein
MNMSEYEIPQVTEWSVPPERSAEKQEHIVTSASKAFHKRI